MGAFLFRSGFAHADNIITKRCSKTITWLFLSRLQGNKPHSPEPSGTFRKLYPEPTPAHTGILWNLPEPASGTYTTTHRDFTCLRNLHQHTPEPSGTFRSLPPEPTPAHAGTLRKLHQHSGTFRNLPPEPTPAHTGTFRNLPPEPTPAHTGTLRNLPEPSSGTCSCDPHRHTPELIWAEDPISLRCWGKTIFQKTSAIVQSMFHELDGMLKSLLGLFSHFHIPGDSSKSIHLSAQKSGCQTLALSLCHPVFWSMSLWTSLKKELPKVLHQTLASFGSFCKMFLFSGASIWPLDLDSQRLPKKKQLQGALVNNGATVFFAIGLKGALQTSWWTACGKDLRSQASEELSDELSQHLGLTASSSIAMIVEERFSSTK